MKIFVAILVFYLMVSCCIASSMATQSAPNYLVILVHGIISNKEAFDGKGNLREFLENEMGLKGYVYAYDFLDNRGSNILAAHQLGDPTNEHYWIGRAKREFKGWYATKYGISVEAVPDAVVPEKVILICHSMGGLASRYYLTSNFYQNDVLKLVTLDTPHIGSDTVTYLKKFWSIENLGKATLSKPVDDLLKNYFNTIKGNITNRFVSSASSSFLANFGFVFNIPTINDIYCSSANWVTAYESPNIISGIGKAMSKQMIVPGYLSVFLKLVEYGVFSGEGLDQLDPDSGFIGNLTAAEIKSGTDPVSFRLVSARGASTPHKDLVKRYYFATPYMNQQLLQYFPEYNNLTNDTEKYWGYLISTFLPGSMCLKDGSIVVAVDSSRGEGVELFKKYDTKRYDFFFKSKAFNTTMDIVKDTYYTCVAIYTASSLFGGAAITPSIFLIPSMQLTFFSITSAAFDLMLEDSDETALKAHIVIPSAVTLRKDDNPSIIEQALDDTPTLGGEFVSSEVKSSISAASVNTASSSFNDYDQTFSLLSNLNADGTFSDTYRTITPEAFTEGAPDPTKSWPIEIDGKKKWVTAVTVKSPPTAVKGVLNTYLPLKLKEFKYSENFAAWKNVPNIDRWGNFTIKDLKLAEGENVIAFKATSFADNKMNQHLKIIVNTIKPDYYALPIQLSLPQMA